MMYCIAQYDEMCCSSLIICSRVVEAPSGYDDFPFTNQKYAHVIRTGKASRLYSTEASIIVAAYPAESKVTYLALVARSFAT